MRFTMTVLIILMLIAASGCNHFHKGMDWDEIHDAIEVQRTLHLNEGETVWLYLDKNQQFYWVW